MSSVDKAIEVLMLLSREADPLGVREIGRRLQMSPPTVHRLLATLLSYDLVQQADGGTNYRLGWACLDLGRRALNGTEVVQAAISIAERVRDATQETVTVQIPVADDQVCVFEAEGLHELRRRVGVGRRVPMHAGASGRAILAFLSEEEIERYLRKPLQKIGPNTMTDPDRLRARLDETRQLGYTTSHEETVVGVVAASVPIFGQEGQVAGSMSVSGPDARLRPDLEARVVPLLVDAGRALSKKLGYRGSDVAGIPVRAQP